METAKYITKGTCSKIITFNIENDILTNVKFEGGCSGNTQGICKLVEGMNVYEVIEKLKGIDCRGRGTSCPDQLSKALEAEIARQNELYAIKA